jgi:hypothetical protein
MEQLLRWVDQDDFRLPLALALHSAFFVGLLLVVFLFYP